MVWLKAYGYWLREVWPRRRRLTSTQLDLVLELGTAGFCLSLLWLSFFVLVFATGYTEYAQALHGVGACSAGMRDDMTNSWG